MNQSRVSALVPGVFVLTIACADDNALPPLADYSGPERVYEYEGCAAGSPCDILTKDCQARLFALSQCVWDAKRTSPPDVRVLDEPQTVAYLTDLVDTVDARPDEADYGAFRLRPGSAISQRRFSFAEGRPGESLTSFWGYREERPRHLSSRRGRLP